MHKELNNSKFKSACWVAHVIRQCVKSGICINLRSIINAFDWRTASVSEAQKRGRGRGERLPMTAVRV